MFNNKMWGRAPLATGLLLALLSVFSCNTPLQGEKPSGTLKISIPCVSPVLQQLYEQMQVESASSRAYAYANKMTIEIYSGGTLYMTENADLAGTGDALLASVALDPGIYTATASIFNYRNSETEPVVAGTSAEFTVTAGDIALVNIFCLPTTPTPLGYEFQTPVVTPAIKDAYTSFYYSLGSEAWYSFTAEDSTVLLEFEAVDPGNFMAILYKDDGSSVLNANFWLNETTSPRSLTGLTAGETYYLVCTSVDYTYNGNETQAGFDGSYSLRLYRNFMDTITASATGSLCSLSKANGLYSLLVSNDVTSVDLEITTFDPAATITVNGIESTDGTATVDVSSGNITVEVTLDGNTQTLVVPISVYTVYSMPYDEVLTLESGMEQTCIITVTSGTSYTVYWDDSYQGTGTYTSDCSVSGSDGAGHSYFSGVDSGYYFGQTFTATSDTLELTVSPTYSAGTVRVWVVENP